MNNNNDNSNEVQHAMARDTRSYEMHIRDAHSALQKGNLYDAFQWYSNAVRDSWRLTLLASDDDSTTLTFWRNEMSNAQQVCTALAVLLKARNTTLPTW